MDRKDTRLLRWSTAVLVISGYCALTAVPSISPVVLLPVMVALACARPAEYLHERFVAYGVVTRVITITYLCFLPLTVLTLNVLNAVVVLICYIQIYTLLHKKQVRNYYHLHLMSLFLLLAASVQTPDPVIGIVMLVFVVSAVWANLALRIVAERIRAADVPEPDIVGLDNLDHHAVHGTTLNRHRRVAALSVGLSLVVVGVTVGFFVLTPRIEAGIFGRSESAVAQTGISESVELTSGTTIQQDTTPVMVVRFPNETDGQVSEDLLYWRVSTLGRYENNTWHRQTGNLIDPGIGHSGPFVHESLSSERDRWYLSRSRKPDTRLIRQDIYIDEIPSRGLPALHLAQSVRLLDRDRGMRLRWGREGDLSVVIEKSESVRRIDYEVESEFRMPSPESLRAAPPFTLEGLNRSSRRRAAWFLSHELSEESVDLANRIAASETNAYDKAMAILDFLSGPDYLYSLSIPEMGDAQVIDIFINESRMGHCELFGTALALMLRTQGIPTRVVSGYRGGEWVESDGMYTIRANMAHLWVEAWFPGEGWIILDPSPRAADTEIGGFGELRLFTSRLAFKAKIFWFQEVVGFDSQSHIRRLRDLSLGVVGRLWSSDDDGDSKPGGVAGGGSRGGDGLLAAAMLLAVVVAFGGMWSIGRLREARIMREVQLNADQLRVVRMYLALRRKLKRYGVDCRGKTAEELRRTLEAPEWGAPAAPLELLDCYNAVRFGGSPLKSGQLARIRGELRKLRPADSSDTED